MSKAMRKLQTDPRGHSLRVYADIYDSPAWQCLSPMDVLAYLALLRELKGYNNGNISLPLSRAKQCGISHHVTLARSLRALCAVGLVAVTRKGGCTRGGQRLPTLYRMTDRDCYDIPKLGLAALAASDEWKRIKSAEQGCELIDRAEDAAKKNPLGHAVTVTTSPNDVVEPKTRTRSDTWNGGLGHVVTMAGTGSKPVLARVSEGFFSAHENSSHRTPDVPPLYIYQSIEAKGDAETGEGAPPALNEAAARLWASLSGNHSKLWHVGPRGPVMGIGTRMPSPIKH